MMRDGRGAGKSWVAAMGCTGIKRCRHGLTRVRCTVLESKPRPIAALRRATGPDALKLQGMAAAA